jgi:pyruvate,water dikinase
MQKQIVWFEEVGRGDVGIVGGKGANLGEMARSGFPVPPGFVVTAQTYFDFVKRTGVWPRILDVLEGLDVEDTQALQAASRKISDIILSAPMPTDIYDAVVVAYRNLCNKRRQQVYVAARSSATAEDLPEASFAGQQATFLDVLGENDVVKAVRRCWASLYTARAIYYRVQQRFDHSKVGIAVAVQEMVRSEVAGVMFTSEPTGSKPEQLIIEAAYGLGESVVGGRVTPDTYLVNKKTMDLLSKKIAPQKKMIVRNERGIGTSTIDVPPIRQALQKLPDSKIKELARIGMDLERHYNFPQDVEWALQEGKLYIVQTRAITTLKMEKKAVGELKGEELVHGLAASPGIASGTVRVVKAMSDLSKVVKGDVLVTRMTTPDYVPAMRRAAAIVTDEGGITSHAAIVSRELAVPCIVGSEKATHVLTEGEVVTVDAVHGIVYKGVVGVEEAKLEPQALAALPATKTKIYINLGVPELAEKYKGLPVDGIGLMREEFIIATYIKIHPLKLIKDGRQEFFINKLAEGIAAVARAFSPRPVVLRLSDFKSNEYRELEGGEEFEPREENPMLGWRGASRYYSDAYRDAFKLELRAIKKVRDEMGLRNLWVMIPFTRTVDEVIRIEQMMREEGLSRGADFKLWLMAEIPANALLAEEFAEHCDGFSIGSNDLTQLTLGVDRDSDVLGRMGLFDENNEAVKKAIRLIIKGAHAKGRTVSLCGQAPSNYPEFARFLVAEGIDSISVNPDAVASVKKTVAEAEKARGG